MTEVLLPVDSEIRRRLDPEGTLPHVEMLSDGTKLAEYGDEFHAFSSGEHVGFCYLRLLFMPPRQLLQQIGYIEVERQNRGYGPAMYLLCFERAERLDAVHVSDRDLSDDSRKYWEQLTSFGVSADNGAYVPYESRPSPLIKLARFYVDVHFDNAVK